MACSVGRSLRGLTAALVLAPTMGCKGGDPKTAKYWVDKTLAEQHERDKKNDVDHLADLVKKTHEPGAAPQVATLLKDQPGDVVARAAEVLGELKDKSTVGPLSDAVDMTRGAGSDKATLSANHANKAIAEALGAIGDKGGTPALLKMLKSKDNYTLIAAIDALGELRDPAAVDTLSGVVTDTTQEPLVTKRAIMALGSIGDPKAIPAVHQMLFKERKDRGISFYAESSFALFQIGKPSVDVLLTDAKGSNKEILAWAKQNDINPAAIYAKSAQILGDLDAPQAEDALIKLLAYKDPDQMMELATRIQAADALGRMRSKAAVKPLSDQLLIAEANARATFCRALTFIGDRSAVPALVKSAKTGPVSARQFAYKAIAILGGESDSKAYDDLLKGEEALMKAECKEAELGDADCATEIKKNKDTLDGYRAALAPKCAQGDVPCWSGLMNDKSPFVRQKAAMELGRSGKAEAVAPLFAAVQKPLDGSGDELVEQDNARFAAILGLHWLVDHGIVPSNVGDLAAKLDKQVDEERSKTATMRSAEDVKRLGVKLHRLAST
jgi:HEAT repeat protein